MADRRTIKRLIKDMEAAEKLFYSVRTRLENINSLAAPAKGLTKQQVDKLRAHRREKAVTKKTTAQ